MNTEKLIKEKIEDLRPYLQMDGGDIEFVKYEDKTLYVKLSGNCIHCMMQDNTLNDGILKMLNEEIPEIKEIINVEL